MLVETEVCSLNEPPPAEENLDRLLACLLERAEQDRSAWTMRRLEEALMEAICLGDKDPAAGHAQAAQLLATLPFMCDADTDDARLERFCRYVARTTLRLAMAVNAAAVVTTQDLILETFATHPAPSLGGLLYSLEGAHYTEAERLRLATVAERLAGEEGRVRHADLLDLATRMRR